VAKPVLVVGNITVGGSGKTPLVVWLCETLHAQGIKVGVISRGYGGNAPQYPYLVTSDSLAHESGDEPLLIHLRTGVPVIVAPDRVAAAQMLTEKHDIDLIISDDGLQHYRLARDIELVVIDGNRRFGNGQLLPQGPLREATWRLQQADFLISNGQPGQPGEHEMRLQPGRFRRLHDGHVVDLDELRGKSVAAAAGIGHPQRFFNTLQEMGLVLKVTHALPDHFDFPPGSLASLKEGADILLVTEKDAVKCKQDSQDAIYYLPITAVLPKEFEQSLLNKIISLVNYDSRPEAG
jgi:tetraacyldisaccharide 4'-kinase